ncbi:MAG: TadE/TadG family type IV pilus assembly protein [Acetobacteraceae bacterium]|jgi:Flp pilus assembly protein TadG
MTRRGYLGRRAVAALEFVLVAPFFIIMTFGIIEFAAAVRIQMGINQAAWSVADLIAQQTDVTTAQLNDFYKAAQDCNSFNVGTLSISATSVTFSAGQPTGSVAWTAHTATSNYATNPANVTTVSSGLGASSGGTTIGGDSTIVVQATSTFNVPIAFGPISKSYTLTSTAFARPRLSYTVSLN